MPDSINSKTPIVSDVKKQLHSNNSGGQKSETDISEEKPHKLERFSKGKKIAEHFTDKFSEAERYCSHWEMRGFEIRWYQKGTLFYESEYT